MASVACRWHWSAQSFVADSFLADFVCRALKIEDPTDAEHALIPKTVEEGDMCGAQHFAAGSFVLATLLGQ